MSHTDAAAVAAAIATRLAKIRVADDYETDAGLQVWRGRIAINDEDVPCVSIIEGQDIVQSKPGRIPEYSIDQHYAICAYVPCDPMAPNDAAHAAIRDIRKVIFAEPWSMPGVRDVTYRGRNIAPRADGVAIVMAIVEITVRYVEKLDVTR